MHTDPFVTVAVFTWAHEMAVVRARLEWEGITCFAKDENIVAAHPLYSNLVGGIKLQVQAIDVERAREILIETGYIDPEPTETASGREIWDQVADLFRKAADLFRLPSIPQHRLRLVALWLLGVGVVALILLL